MKLSIATAIRCTTELTLARCRHLAQIAFRTPSDVSENSEISEGEFLTLLLSVMLDQHTHLTMEDIDSVLMRMQKRIDGIGKMLREHYRGDRRTLSAYTMQILDNRYVTLTGPHTGAFVWDAKERELVDDVPLPALSLAVELNPFAHSAAFYGNPLLAAAAAPGLQ